MSKKTRQADNTRMSDLYYRLLLFFTGIFGTWIFRVGAWFVATGFFLFFPGRVAVGVRFYRALFPGKGGFHHLRCTWKQYHNFTSVFLDRVLLQYPERITYTSQGLEHLAAAAEKKEGGIILMSHIGNWEIAARLLQGKGLKLLLYMGIRDKERIERIQKETLAESGVTIVAVEQDRESPLEILEGVKFIREGGFVSITGDRTWRSGQRTVPVDFLGRHADVPEAPHLLALLAKAPVFIFFIFHTGRGSYHITCSGPLRVTAAARSDRTGAIRKSAQAYAGRLEEAVREHPLEWYHFEQYLRE